jgi:methyl-accepting chemotaxis protein
MKKVLNSKYSIKNKLIFSFVSITIISLLLMGMITYTIVVSQTKKDYTNSIQKEIIHVNNGIEDYLELILENTRMLSQSSLIQQADSRITSYVDKEDPSGKVKMTPLENDPYEAEVYNTFKNFKDTHPEIASAEIGVQSNGGYVQYPVSARKNGYDARTRDWYKLALESPDKPVLTDVYISSDGTKSIISASANKRFYRHY